MAKSNFPNGFAQGVIIRGVPLTVTNPGESFWVNSTSVEPEGGYDGGAPVGSYLNPFGTITKAMAACVANRGDIVYVMPGYTESVSASDLAISTVAGVAIIGMGSGGLKPTFTSTATGSLVTCAVNNVSIYNLRFVANVASVVSGLSITGEDFSMDSCELMSNVAASDFDIGLITSAAAMGLSVTNCTFNSESSVAGLAVTEVPAVGLRTLGDRSFIAGNSFLGNFSTSAIHNVTTAVLGSTIIDNDIYNISTTAAGGLISLAAGCSGLIMRNMGTCLETTAIAGLIVNPACAMSENYAVNVLTETGGVVGAAST